MLPTRTAWESAPRDPRNSIPGPAPVAAVPLTGAVAPAPGDCAGSCRDVAQAAARIATMGSRRREVLSIEASCVGRKVGGGAMLPSNLSLIKGLLRTAHKTAGQGGRKAASATTALLTANTVHGTASADRAAVIRFRRADDM